MAKEVWKSIAGYEGLYEISSYGRVRRVDHQRFVKPTGRRYMRVGLWKNGKSKTHSVHRLVLETFVGPCPEGMQTSHLNGCSTDNRLQNLAWESPIKNNSRKLEHGTMPHGSKCHFSKLNKVKVKSIRRLRKKGYSQRGIGEIVGVSQVSVGNVLNGRTWKHV